MARRDSAPALSDGETMSSGVLRIALWLVVLPQQRPRAASHRADAASARARLAPSSPADRDRDRARPAPPLRPTPRPRSSAQNAPRRPRTVLRAAASAGSGGTAEGA